MAVIFHSKPFRRFVKSKVGLALPVTFLILLVSTLALITVTYYFAVGNVDMQSEALKVSTAQQDFVSLDNDILSTLGQPGSSSTIVLSDSGGTTNIQPTSNILTINVSDNPNSEQTIFSSPVGQVTYDLPCLGSLDDGFYLAGDSQTITNQSGASPGQLYITDEAQGPQIQLQYRPTVTYATAGYENGKTINDVRIYIINLNSSLSVSLQGELPLQISCTNTQLTTETLSTNQPENLTITSQLNGANGSVSIPISSTPDGSMIYIEIVISNVSIERWIQ